MKKTFLVIALVSIFASSALAYEPPVGGENLFDLASPHNLTYASSVVGGGVSNVGPTSLIVNPALAAREQRVGLHVAYTALLTTGDPFQFGSAFQTAIMIPFKWSVFSGYVNGTFPNSALLDFSNSINLKASLSKEITDKLSVGLGINGGFAFGKLPDWLLSGNIGFVYNLGEVGFIKDFRYGVSVSNLGKNYTVTSNAGFIDCYPGFALVRVGAAGLFVSNQNIKIGLSLDLSTPGFMNLLVDAGLQFTIKDMLTLSVAEKINLLESIKGNYSFIPSVGLFFKFRFDVAGNEFLASHDWSQSEMMIGAAYKNLYSDLQTISASVDISLGLKDETPPVIEIWFGDEDDEEEE